MADESKRPVCAVVGVGPGNGEALARRFAADGYAIALMARRTELTARLAGELPLAKSYACDVTEAASVEAASKKLANAFSASSRPLTVQLIGCR